MDKRFGSRATTGDNRPVDEPAPVSTSDDGASAPDAGRSALSRRAFLKTIGATAVAAGAVGIYSTQIEPFWLHVHERPIPVRGLPADFIGFRIVQLTDLHVGNHVPLWYMRRVIRHANAFKPDLVVVTGDLVHHTPTGVKPVAGLLSMLEAPVIVSLGNHDYDAANPNAGGPIRHAHIAEALEAELAPRGIEVLRNRAIPIMRGGSRLWIVGLEDYYTAWFSPERAFAEVPRDEPSLVMSHNPDTAYFFEGYNVPLILAGHTHGGQVRIPFYGAPILPIAHRQLADGLHTVNQSRIHISRGVGYIRRIRFNCRPELPCLRLEAEGRL